MKYVGIELLLFQKFGNLPDFPTFSILKSARNLDNQIHVKQITVIKSKEMFSFI